MNTQRSTANNRISQRSVRTLCQTLLLSLLFWGSGCSSSDLTEWPGDGGTPMAPTITVELSTKTLNSNDELVTYPEGENLVGTQHATTVIIYLFKGIGEAAEYCGIEEDIQWWEHFTANGGTLPTHTVSMQYQLKNKLKPNTPYEFLAVGMNDEGAAAFKTKFTAMVAADTIAHTPAINGTSLAEAIGQLKTTSAKDIRRSEIYVGTATYQPGLKTTITLHRRVAGISAYFKNVPEQILTAKATDKNVAKLRLKLYEAQNIHLPLLPKPQRPDFLDFVPSPALETDPDKDVLVEITPKTPKGVWTAETLWHGSAFALPIPAPADQNTYTLRLELLNQKDEVLSTRRIKLPKNDDLNHGETGGGTGIIDTESAYRFPIIANHYYSIGTENSPIDLKGAGADIVITLDPTWKEEADLELGDKEQP